MGDQKEPTDFKGLSGGMFAAGVFGFMMLAGWAFVMPSGHFGNSILIKGFYVLAGMFIVSGLVCRWIASKRESQKQDS